MRSSPILAISFALSVWALGGGAAGAAGEPELGHPPGEFVEVHGAKLWVESEGEGTPVILIAGGPGLTHDYFHPYFSSLSRSHQVIYYDAFGRGKSDRAKRPDEYTFRRDVEDLEGLRRALGLPRVSLYGHSYGVLVAQAYALQYPQSVDRVVLANSIFSGKMWQESEDAANRQIRETLPDVWAKVQDLRAHGLRSSAQAHQEAYRLPPGYYWHQKPALHMSVNNDVFYAIVGEDADFVIGGEIAGLSFEHRLKELKAPLLVIAGRYDNIAPLGRVLAVMKEAPRATLAVFEESGHFSFAEEPDKTQSLLQEFLAR